MSVKKISARIKIPEYYIPTHSIRLCNHDSLRQGIYNTLGLLFFLNQNKEFVYWRALLDRKQ